MSDHKILMAMRKYGGGFVSALAWAAMNADDANLARIKAAFPDLWELYTKFARTDALRERANCPECGGKGFTESIDGDIQCGTCEERVES